jgi:AcrR family transcriptional regulator
MNADDRVKSKRERLLDTAEALFLEKGYENVSVRELTGAANTNVAAINYYFQSKENLYRESVRRRLSSVANDLISDMKKEIYGEETLDLRKIIKIYVTEYMSHVLTVKEAGRFIEAISRDMSEGGIITDILIEELVAPVHMILKEAISRVRPDIPEEKVSLYIISIGGQMFHFIRAREIIKRMMRQDYSKEFINRIIEHIVDFSFNGMG